METENFAALDLQKEYYETVHAARMASTVVLLLSAGWSWMQSKAVEDANDIFYYTVRGGFRTLPSLTQFAIAYYKEALALSCLASFSAVLYLWVAGRSLSRVILATTAGVFVCLLSGFVMQVAISRPLQTQFLHYEG